MNQVLTTNEFHSRVAGWHLTSIKSLDIETNGKEVWEQGSRMAGLSLASDVVGESGKIDGFYVPLAHTTGQNADPDLLPTILSYLNDKEITVFSLTTEAAWFLSKLNFPLRIVDDPFIASRLLQLFEYSLKDLTEKYLSRRVIRLEEILGAGNYDFTRVNAQDPRANEYAAADAINNLLISRVMKGKIAASKMEAVYHVEVQSGLFMVRQTLAGYEMNLQMLEAELKQEEIALVGLEDEIFKLLGCEPFPLNSSKKLGAALTSIGISSPGKTKKGNESWSKDNLAQIHHAHPSIPLIMDWKSRFSVRNTLRKSPARVGEDGKIHPRWKSIGMDGTSRMYAENPSITSLPESCRRSMPAPKGKRWFKFDWAQAEVRFLAALSGDQNLKEALAPGKDFHREIIGGMKGVDPNSVSDAEREMSKVITYSILYSGGSAYHVARGLGISMGEANEKVREYFQRFPKLESYLKGIRQNAVSTFHGRSWMNRLRRFDGDAEHRANQACDAIGQQSCGTALKVVLLKMARAQEQGIVWMKGFSQVIPVFDAIFYCLDEDVPVAKHLEFVREIVELDIEGVKMVAEFELGKAWGDLTPVHENSFAQAVADLSR